MAYDRCAKGGLLCSYKEVNPPVLKTRIIVCITVCLALVCGGWALNNHYSPAHADTAGSMLKAADSSRPLSSRSFAPREYVRLTRPIRPLQAE